MPEWLRPLVRAAKSGCWIWQKRVGPDGYGKAYVDRREVPAHRMVFQRFHGVVLGKKEQVCHHCDNRKCVRLDHLFRGTAKTNSEDMVKKGRQAFGERSGTAKLTAVQVKEIVALYRGAKMTQVELAKKYRVLQTTISFIVTGRAWSVVTGIKYEKHGLGHPHGPRVVKHMKRGAAHHSTPLTARDVRRLRQLRERDGWTYERLGEHFGISEVAARAIVIRKTWRHVT